LWQHRLDVAAAAAAAAAGRPTDDDDVSKQLNEVDLDARKHESSSKIAGVKIRLNGLNSSADRH